MNLNMLHKLVGWTLGLSAIVWGDTQTIHLTADEWCPYTCQEQSKKQGYMIDLATEIFKRQGYQVDYIVESSWKNAIEQTRIGNYQGLVGTARADAPDFIFPKHDMGSFDNCFVTRKSNAWNYEGVKSLESVKLGIIVDYSYGDELNRYIHENTNNPKRLYKTSGNKALSYNLTRLKHGKMDVYVDDCRVLNYELNLRNDKHAFRISAKKIKVDTIFIAFSPNDPNSKKYVKILDEGLVKLKKEGLYEQILHKYD